MSGISAHIFRSAAFRSVVKEAITFFENTPVMPLPPRSKFEGTGAYAIYYRGQFEPYLPLQKLPVCPIYVGKAVPEGWRQGRKTDSEATELFSRLNQHANSISQVNNLDLKDFTCRFMILAGVEGDLVVPVEAELIRKYRPLWNSVVDGFGNHDPGKGRYEQSKSEWDVLHPGRDWAKRLNGPRPKLTIIKKNIGLFFR